MLHREKMTMTAIVAQPLSAYLGARVTGVDTTRPMDGDTLAQVADLFHRHHALVIPGPVLSPHDYVAFVRQLGNPDPSDTSRYHKAVDVDGFKGLRMVSNIEEGGRNLGQFGADEMGWHQDRWTDEAPPPATALHGVEVTREGGRTGVASLIAAWSAMPEDLKARIRGRSIHFPLQVNDFEGSLDDADIENPALFRKVPLVQRHAVTGEDYLFLGARRILAYIDTAPRVTGLGKQESADLIDAIHAHVSQPQFSYLHQWTPGDTLLFDNRACAHRRESFDPAQRRLLYGAPLLTSDLLWAGKVPLAA
jgi:taurine dioxygenase